MNSTNPVIFTGVNRQTEKYCWLKVQLQLRMLGYDKDICVEASDAMKAKADLDWIQTFLKPGWSAGIAPDNEKVVVLSKLKDKEES